MSQKERFRRNEPERAEPIRWMSGALRGNGRAKPHDEHSEPDLGGADSSPWRGVVERTVRIGYEIADAQIRKGQEVAEQLSDRLYKKSDSSSGDVRHMTEDMLRSFGQLASGWVNLTTSLLNSAGAAGKSTPDMSPRNGERPGATSEASSTFALEIVSRRPTAVTVRASAPAATRSWAARPLRAAEAGKPPLVQVSFAPAQNGSDISIRIRIPDDQPSGIYQGDIYDLKVGTVAGQLIVEIRD